MMNTNLALTPLSLVGITTHLRNACPPFAARPIDPSRTAAVRAQWAHDVDAIATWLETTVPGFDRDAFVHDCEPTWSRRVSAVYGRDRR